MKLSDAVYGHRHGAAGLRPLVPLANHTRSQGFGFHPVTKSVVFDTQNFGGLSECSLQYNASDSAKKGITRLALNSPIAQMRADEYLRQLFFGFPWASNLNYRMRSWRRNQWTLRP